MGWVITLCAGAGWFGGVMQPELAQRVFSDPNVCLAGSGSVTGTAEKVDGGFLINGDWPYATGAPFATSFTVNCHLVKDGSEVMDSNNKPAIMSFLLNKDEVSVKGDWNAMGMLATASHSISVSGKVVPEDRAFLAGNDIVISTPLYHYPFQQLAEATLSVNLSGMAVHFLDICDARLAEKLTHGMEEVVGNTNVAGLLTAYRNKLNAARQKLYYAVDMSWQVCMANKEISTSLLYKVTVASLALARAVRDCVNTVYPFCGLSAADKDSEINRVWRDIQTAGQHSLLLDDVGY
jgi:alkylation response protein AidB-like acyl-CoA dehydrogenase